MLASLSFMYAYINSLSIEANEVVVEILKNAASILSKCNITSTDYRKTFTQAAERKRDG